MLQEHSFWLGIKKQVRVMAFSSHVKQSALLASAILLVNDGSICGREFPHPGVRGRGKAIFDTVISKYLMVLILGLVFYNATGQDTTVVAEGKILNALTNELVEARITFSSLPYASKVGYMRGSTYSLPLYDNEKYSMVVTAQGYEPYKITLDPAEGNAERKLLRDILLKAPNAPVPVVQQPVELPKPNVGETTRLNILFAQSSFTILPTSYGELDALANTLKKHGTMEIQLEGHTDIAGDAKSNMKLSKDRVDAVKKYLILKGISGSRIKTKAFGESQPLSTSGTPEAARQNRRVEMRVLKN